jgi:hypothetical protein
MAHRAREHDDIRPREDKDAESGRPVHLDREPEQAKKSRRPERRPGGQPGQSIGGQPDPAPDQPPTQ